MSDGADAPICQVGRSGGFAELLTRTKVGHDALVDLACEEAFETPDDLSFGPPIRRASDDRVDRRLVIAHTDDDDSMEGRVGLSVPAPVEAVSTGRHAGRGRDGTGTAELGEGGLRANPLGIIPEDGQQRGRGVRADGEALSEGRRCLGRELREVPVMRRDFLGEGEPPTSQRPEGVLARRDGRVERTWSKSRTARDEGTVGEGLQRLS